MRKYTFILLFVLIEFIATDLFAKNLYVNNSSSACSDSTTYANNTASFPFCTLGRALWGNASKASFNNAQAAQAGDVVLVTPGVYSAGVGNGQGRSPSIYPVNTGTAANPITIRKNGTGVFEVRLSSGCGSTLGGCGTVGVLECPTGNSDHTIWDGVYVNEAASPLCGNHDGRIISMWRCNGCQILNSEVKGALGGDAGENHDGIGMEYSQNVLIKNNYVHGVRSNAGDNANCILMYYNQHVIIENNLFDDCYGGIRPKGGNTQDDITARFNKITNCSIGLHVSYHSNEPQNVGQIAFYQNIVTDSDGILFWGDLKKVRFVNNTFYLPGSGVRSGNLELTDQRTSVIYQNNIFSDQQGNSEVIALGNVVQPLTGLTGDYNLMSGYTRFGSYNLQAYATKPPFVVASGLETHSIDLGSGSSSAIFVNKTAGDFHLKAGSPALNAGVDILDLNHNGLFTDAINMGAYITGNETIGRITSSGPPDTTPPAKPTGLRVQ